MLRHALFAVLMCLITVAAASQQGASPPAIEGQQQFAAIGDLPLASGEVIRDCRVGYRTWGTLNAARSNAVLVPTWFGGRSEGLAGSIGPGKLYDSSRYFVIAVDALGDGVSCSPSNSASQPGSKFPKFTINDMVESQHRMLERAFSLNHVYAVSGISMGGMQTFAWMVRHPEFMDKAIPIVGTPKQTAFDLLLWNAELQGTRESSDYRSGGHRVPGGVKEISQLNLTTPQNIVQHNAPQQFPAWVKQIDDGAALDADDYIHQLEAMMAQDISAPLAGSMEQGARAVKAKVLIVVATQDHMVNPTPALAFAALLRAPTLQLTGDCGHLATACESDKLVPAVHDFLNQ